MSPLNYDVIVVGAGQVGATLALQLSPLLAARGQRLALVEASDAEPAEYRGEQFDPRVVALTPASRRLYEQLGLWRHIAAERASPYQDMLVWDGEASGRIGFHADELDCDQLGHIVENSVMVRHLRQALTYQSVVEWFRPATVTGLTRREDDSMAVVLDDERTLVAPLVIAADGAHSRVRELAQFNVREWPYAQKAIVTTVRTERPHGQTAHQRFMRTGPLAFLPLRCHWGEAESSGQQWDEHYSSIVWSADSALAEELLALDDAAFCERLGRDFEYTLGAVTAVDRRHGIPLYQRHARDYIRPGIALVGDAAHSIHPLAGQGVNLGLKDVQALYAEIERALNRGLPLSEPSILRRYQRHRLGDNLGMMATMEGFKRLFGSTSPTWIALRNTGLRRIDGLSLIKNTLAQKAMGV